MKANVLAAKKHFVKFIIRYLIPKKQGSQQGGNKEEGIGGICPRLLCKGSTIVEP